MTAEVAAQLCTRTVLTILLAVGGASAHAVNDGCSPSGDALICPLAIGQSVYTVALPRKYLQLNNQTGGFVQINQVWPQPTTPGYWAEACVNRLPAPSPPPGQVTPGVGEVGCITKEANETQFGGLQWDGIHTALSVPTGASIFVQGNTHSGPNVDYGYTFTVTAYPQSSGVDIYRQPRRDAVIACNGDPQQTAFEPWINNTGHDLAINGATIYAATPSGPSVQAACAYILNAAGAVRWSNCALATRGTQFFGEQVVHPGEGIAGQALHTCPAGGVWDWAAYIYTYNK